MFRKISLSAMAFTYFFAGLAHFLKADYFVTFIPPVVPQPKLLIWLTGGAQAILATLFLPRKTRRGACYGILLLWGVSLPINFYTIATGGAGTSYTAPQLAALIPFHLFLMLWAFWHSRETAGSRQVSGGSINFKNTKSKNPA